MHAIDGRNFGANENITEHGSTPGVPESFYLSSFLPDSLFHSSNPRCEFEFILRFVTRILSLVDLSDEAFTRAKSGMFEKQFCIEAFNCGTYGISTRIPQDVIFIAKLIQKCCFSLTTVVSALDLVLRLFEKKLICFHSTTWRSLLVTCLLLAEKMWEDNFVHPQHIIGQFNHYCPGQTSHSKRAFLFLQLAVTDALQWKANMTLLRYKTLVGAIMATEVPYCVSRVLTSSTHAQFIPRPLPAIPKMDLPCFITSRRNRNVLTISTGLERVSSGSCGGIASSGSTNSLRSSTTTGSPSTSSTSSSHQLPHQHHAGMLTTSFFTTNSNGQNCRRPSSSSSKTANTNSVNNIGSSSSCSFRHHQQHLPSQSSKYYCGNNNTCFFPRTITNASLPLPPPPSHPPPPTTTTTTTTTSLKSYN